MHCYIEDKVIKKQAKIGLMCIVYMSNLDNSKSAVPLLLKASSMGQSAGQVRSIINQIESPIKLTMKRVPEPRSCSL